MDLSFEIKTKIQKPIHEVYEGIADPKKLSAYFTTGGAKGRMEEGATVTWDFADFPGAFPVDITEAVQDQVLEFEWGSIEKGNRTKVRINFENLGPHETRVTISESGWKN